MISAKEAKLEVLKIKHDVISDNVEDLLSHIERYYILPSIARKQSSVDLCIDEHVRVFDRDRLYAQIEAELRKLGYFCNFYKSVNDQMHLGIFWAYA